MKEPRWKCSHCGRMYSTHEILALPRVQAAADDPDLSAPMGHGYLNVCVCGKVFHRDKWKLQEYVAGPDDKDYWVSTVHLELNHGFWGTELWYETMVKRRDDVDFLDYQDRYTTQAEAEAGHALAISKVQSGEIHT